MRLITIIGTFVFLLAATNPAGILGLLFLQELSIPIACCFWYVFPTIVLGDYLIRLAALGLERVEGESRCAFDRHWLAVPVCGLLWLSVFVTAWPIKLRFAGSQVAFDLEAKRLLAGASKPAGGVYLDRVDINRWIGTYYVEMARVDASNSQVEFILDGNSIIWWGFYYDPAGMAGGIEVSKSWTSYVYVK